MRSNKMRFARILPAMLLGGIFVLSGCDNSKDIYNPDRIQEEAKKVFPVKDIDPNQTWETSTVRNASIAINEKTGEVYTIKLYSGNPYNINGDARLLAKATVADGQTANFKFDAPAALGFVYVMKVNSKGYSSAIPVAIENGAVKVTFGDTNTRAMSNRTITASANTIKQFTTLPTEAPAGSVLLSSLNNPWSEVKERGNYIADSNIKEINVSKPINLYIQGDVKLTKLYINNNPAGLIKIYILPNSTLTVIANQTKDIKSALGQNEKMTFFSIESGYEISIGKEANLNCDKAIVFNQHTSLYNCGTINATHIEFNNNSQFVNDGKVALTNLFSCENTECQVENNGEIKAGSFHLAGSSAFYNESTGAVTITGESAIDSNSSTWDNQGFFKSKTMTFKSTSENWFNRCKLYVDETLTIATSGGRIVMDAGSYTECKDLKIDMSRIEMGNKAFINVLNTAYLKWNTDNNGFYAIGDSYALLRMNTAAPYNDESGYRITYSGNLFVASNKHFEQGSSSSLHYELKNGAKLSGADNADIVIPSSKCNPGYNSTPDGGGDNDTPQAYAYSFEDMMQEVGDYDFNDVVLYISTPIDGKITVSLQAAGATKKLSVGFNNNGNIQNVFADIHEALKVPAGTITNTGMTNGTVATAEIPVGKDFSLTNNGDFYISDGKREIHIPNFTIDFKPGNVPYALRIASATWKWAKERIQITEAYPDFAGWAQDATAEPTWYNNPVSGKVME